MAPWARVWIGLVACGGVAAVIACGDDDSAAVDRAELAAPCFLDSDCNPLLRCAFQTCHVECEQSRDCENGERCVSAARPFNVCQRKDEAKCNYNSECSGQQRCASDHQCRDACAASADCVTGQVCITGACAEPAELVDGGLPANGTPVLNSGASCLHPSDCVLPLTCVSHKCGVECVDSRDCSYDRVCEGDACKIPVSGGGTIAAGACEHDSDCPSPLACLFQQCAYQCINERDCDGVACVAHVCSDSSSSDGGHADGGSDSGGDASDGAGPVTGDGGMNIFADTTSFAAGDRFTCEVHASTHAVKCWGTANYGELGAGNMNVRGTMLAQMGPGLPTVSLGTGRTALAVAAKGSFACALLDDHSVKCWGANDSGQLGQGDRNARGDGPGEMGDSLLAINLGVGRTATKVAAGLTHACAILDNGQLKCWGSNGFGELGQGDTNNRGDDMNEMGAALLPISLGTGRTAIDVSCNYGLTCAVLDDHSVKCWGYAADGQLGQENFTQHGNVAGTMGDSLLAIRLGTGRTVTSIATGLSYACALLDNGKVKCWGSNGGQLGQETTANRGGNTGDMGDGLPLTNLGTNYVAVALSGSSATMCALLNDASLKCWGANAAGALGQGDTNPRGGVVGTMGDMLQALRLGTGRTVKSITVGGYAISHGCARLDNGAMKCWGSNLSGELGQGDGNNRGDDMGEMADALLPILLE